MLKHGLQSELPLGLGRGTREWVRTPLSKHREGVITDVGNGKTNRTRGYPTATCLMGLPGEGVGVITYVGTPELIRKKAPRWVLVLN